MGAALKALSALDMRQPEMLSIVEIDGMLTAAASMIYGGISHNAIGQPYREQAEALLGRLRLFGVPIPQTLDEAQSVYDPATRIEQAEPSAPEDDEQPDLSPASVHAIGRLHARLEGDHVLADQFMPILTEIPQWIEKDTGVQCSRAQQILWLGNDPQSGRLSAILKHVKFGIIKRVPLA